jgi:hypothetical protein
VEGKLTMTKPWDETMKQLIDASPQELIDWLAPGGVFQEFVLTELVKPKEEEGPSKPG